MRHKIMVEKLPRKRFEKGLGRGLSALLAEHPDDRVSLDKPRQAHTVPLGSIVPNQFQPRRKFDPEELQALSRSIKTNGILMPILVRRLGDGNSYEIVAGERRWRAAQEAQLNDVPVVVRELNDKQSLELALVENIQRQDLTSLEEAEGYQRLITEFKHTQEEIAQASGKSRSYIANTLRLLGLPDVIKDMLQDGRLSAGHARALLVADQPEILAKKVIVQGLNVRQTEQLVKKRTKIAGNPVSSEIYSNDSDTRALEYQLSEKLGLVVTIAHKGERGEVRIKFASLDQFDAIVQRLNRQSQYL